MLSIAIQVLLLASAMLVNFVVPAIYGLEAYGAFIQANILVFLIQKLSDLMTEPLISRVTAASVYPLALLVSVSIWILFALANTLTELGSIALLAAMLLSSCAMLSMHALGLRRHILAALLVFLGIFLGLMLAKYAGIYYISIRDILFWTNFIPAIGSAVALLRNGVVIPDLPELKRLLKTTIRMTPENFSVSLVFNLFTNLLPYIFSKTLPLAELGLFRVITALVQSATTVFPINTKAIFVAMLKSGDKIGQIKIILVWSSIYFAIVGAFALGAAVIEPKFLPYVALVASLPTLYWTVMLERYLQAAGRRRPLIIVNFIVGTIVLGATFLVDTVQMATYCYAFGLALYAGSLLSINRSILPIVRLSPVVFLSPAIVWLQSLSLLFPLAYFAGILLMMGVFFRPSRDDVNKMRASL